jgi:type VI secretion system protein ImpA
MTAISVGEELIQAIAPDRPCGDDLEDSAVLRTDGLSAFAQTLTVASRWLEMYWRETYPRIDEDGIFRRNALNYFADPIAIIDGVRRAPIVTSAQHGSYSLRDIELAAGLIPADGKAPPEQARIDAALAAASRDKMARLQETVAAALKALVSIDARMTEDGVNAAPSFQPLSSQLAKIDRLLRKQLTPVDAGESAAPADGDGAAPQQGEVAGAPVGAIRSRQDAIRALDAVADYFRRHEPSSPVPLFVDRAKRLVAKDFLEVLADIAPGAVSDAKAAGGIRD